MSSGSSRSSLGIVFAIVAIAIGIGAFFYFRSMDGEVDPNNPLAFLDQKMAGPSCGEAVWHFLGLSMAAWNALISLIAAVWIATSKP
jgi:disulfide bond formation protein DsbB